MFGWDVQTIKRCQQRIFTGAGLCKEPLLD